MNGHKNGDSEPADDTPFHTPGTKAPPTTILSTRGHNTIPVWFDPSVIPDPPTKKTKKTKTSASQRIQLKSSLRRKKQPTGNLRDEAHGRVVYYIQTPLYNRGEQMMKQHELVIPEEQTIETYCQNLALDIESFIYASFTDDNGKPTAEYSTKIRSIIFNLNKNPVLSAEVLYNGISPEKLTTMTSEDMAPGALKKLMAEVRLKTDISITLTKDTGPRIRKNHKGDELVEDVHERSVICDGEDSLFCLGVFPESVVQDAVINNIRLPFRRTFSLSNVLDRITPRSEVIPINTSIKNGGNNALCQKNTPIDIYDDSSNDISPISSPIAVQECRMYSDTAPRTNVRLTIRDTPDLQEKSRGWDVYDSQPKAAPIQWMGRVEMDGITSICATAMHIGGSSFAAGLRWSELLEGILHVDGDVDAEAAGSFLQSFESSYSDKVIMVSLSPTDMHDIGEIQKLYDYYESTRAYGAVTRHALTCIRVAYILFFDTHDPVPLWFSSLNPRPKIHNSWPPAKLLFVVFVVTDNSENLICINDDSARQISIGSWQDETARCYMF